MSFVTDTQEKIESLARRIKKSNPTGANRLMRLNEALGGGAMADAWSNANLHDIINADAIVERLRSQDIPNRGLRALEWFRNVLLLAPLVWTWLAISQAVSTYTQFVNTIRANPHLDQTQITLPFLYLWQQGFGGRLSSGFILSSVALDDSVIVFVILLLTGLVHIRTHLRSGMKEQEAELLYEDLTDALGDAALCLTVRPGQQPTNVMNIAHSLLDELRKERERLDQLATRREKEFGDLQTFTNALSPIAQSMLNAANQIRQSCGTLTQGLNDITQPIVTIGDQHQQLLRDMSQLTQLQQGVSSDVKQLIQDQKSWSTDLTDAIDEFSSSEKRINQMVNNIGACTTQLTDAVKLITAHQQSQTTVSQMTAQAATGLEDALKEIKSASVSMRSLAVDLSDIVSIQRDFPNVVKSGLADVIRDYSSAANSVAQGGSNLNVAANNINTAGKMLYDVANRINGNGRMGP